MAVTFVDASSALGVVSTGTPVPVVLPSGIDANDLILIPSATGSGLNAVHAITGYTQIGTSVENTDEVWLHYKRADGSEDGATVNVDRSGSTGIVGFGAGIVFRGVQTSSDPHEALQSATGATTTITTPTQTLTSTDRLLVCIIESSDDAFTLPPSNLSGGNVTWTLRFNAETATGNDGSIFIYTGVPSSTSVTASTLTQPTAVAYVVRQLALIPAAAGTAHNVNPSDTITLSDSALKALVQGRTDTITLSDIAAKSGALAKADTITLSDAAAKNAVLPRTDTISLSDLMTPTILKLIALSDTITLSDAAAKNMASSQSDSVTLSDALTRAWVAALALADTLTITDDPVAFDYELVTDDVLTLADELTSLLGVSHTRSPADTITMADAFTKAATQARADVLSLSDAVAKQSAVTLTDTLTITDAQGKSFVLGPSDLITLSDASAKVFGLAEGDTISLSDALNVLAGASNHTLELADAISLTDDFMRALNGQFLCAGESAALRTILMSRFGIY